MAIQGSNNGIRNVGISQQAPSDNRPANGASQTPAVPARDISSDANRLNKLTSTSNFRAGTVLGRSIPSTNPAERALPGGNIAAAFGRAEEYGEVADAAAARVAANHPEIFC